MKKQHALLLLGLLLVNVLSAQIAAGLSNYYSANNIYWGWNGSSGRMMYKVDGTDFSTLLPADISGHANSATLWNGTRYDGSNSLETVPEWIMGYHAATGSWKPASRSAIRLFLGVPENGETLQSVTTRGTETNHAIFVSGDDAPVAVPVTSVLGFGYDRSSDYARIVSFNYVQNSPRKLTLNERGGYVGIGTTNPLTQLHVAGNVLLGGVNIDPAIPNAIPGIANTGSLFIGWNRSSGGGETDFIANRGAGHSGGYSFYDYDNSGNLNTLMRLSGNGDMFINGNQTIGSTAAQKELHVNGFIKTRKLKITQTEWADYVFDSAYQLQSLEKLENYILKNKHLPDIPSEAEVKKEGIDVGGNQTLLLKKIEELTLYIIQQNKEIKAQNQEIQNRDKDMQELKDRLRALELKQ